MEPRRALLCLDDCSARKSVPVEIVGEVGKRYRVHILEAVVLTYGGALEVGDVKLVPKYDVVLRGTDGA